MRHGTAALIALAGLGHSVVAAATVQNADAIAGRWETGQQHGVVEIYVCGRSICGRVVDGDPLRANADQRDIRNHDPSLRDRRVMHLAVLQNFSGGPDEWSGGPVYDPVTGERAPKGRIALTGPDTLTVKGCIAVILCRTQTWTRAR